MRIFGSLLSCLIALNSIPVWADQTAQYEQCAVDLCGPASNYARILARGSFGNANHESKAFIQDKLDPLLDQAFQIALKNKAAAAQLAESYVKKTDLTLSNEQKAFVLAITYMSVLSKIMPEILKSADGRVFQVDKEKLTAKLPQVSAQQIDLYKTVLDAVLATDYFQAGIALDGSSYDDLVSTWGSNAKRYIEQFRSSITTLLMTVGSGIRAKMNEDVVEKAFKDPRSLTDTEKKAFISTISTIYRGLGMTATRVILVTKHLNVQLADAAVLLKWNDKYKNIQETLASSQRIEASKKETRDKCHEAWAQSLASAPSELRQRQSEKLLNQVKTSGKRVMPRYFVGEALARANETVDKMTFTKPLTLQQIQNYLIDSLSTSVKEEGKFEGRLRNSSTMDSVSYTIMGLIGPLDDEFNIFQSIQEQCKSMAPRHLVDAAYQENNSIVKSWQSTMFPEIGAGVLAHELGHIVSHAVKSASKDSIQGFTEARTCSIKKHAQLAQNPDVDKFKQYAEEDWADVFAADVILDLEKSWPYSANFACGLLDQEDKEFKYKGLEIWNPQGIDTHSSSFLRALQIQTALKKPLPASCVQAMKPHEKAVVSQSCAQ